MDLKQTKDNLHLLIHYKQKMFEVGNGKSHPYKKVKGLQNALDNLDEMKRISVDNGWDTRCKCIETNECFMVTEGHIKKQNC